MGKGRGRGGAMDEEKRYECYQLVCGCCLLPGAILILILVPLSFVKLQYYEHGLLTQRSTSTVNRDKVYGPGSHQVGPDYEFKVFQTSLINFESSLSVWTKSGGDDAGVAVTIDVSFQYKLQVDNIPALYDSFALNFERNIESVAIDALKNTAPLFGADDYLIKRPEIEMSFARNVARHRVRYATVIALQLRRVSFEDDYYTTKEAAAIQIETNEKEGYVQTASLVRTNTDVLAEKIENEAFEVTEAAIATPEFMIATAEHGGRDGRERAEQWAQGAVRARHRDRAEGPLGYLLLPVQGVRGRASPPTSTLIASTRHRSPPEPKESRAPPAGPCAVHSTARRSAAPCTARTAMPAKGVTRRVRGVYALTILVATRRRARVKLVSHRLVGDGYRHAVHVGRHLDLTTQADVGEALASGMSSSSAFSATTGRRFFEDEVTRRAGELASARASRSMSLSCAASSKCVPGATATCFDVPSISTNVILTLARHPGIPASGRSPRRAAQPGLARRETAPRPTATLRRASATIIHRLLQKSRVCKKTMRPLPSARRQRVRRAVE